MRKMMNKFSILFVTLSLFLISSDNLFAAEYSGGGGTEVSPYEIATAADLMQLSNTQDDWGKHFKLTADIDMTGQPFKPIGYKNSSNVKYAFSGTFDGNLHVIENLTVSAYADHHGAGGLGLFGLFQAANVTNVGLVNLTIFSDVIERVGGIVGQAEWGGTIDNCFVLNSAIHGRYRVGGIVGLNESTPISNCFVDAAISKKESWGDMGGIVANLGATYSSGSSVSNCTFYGTLSAGNAIAGKIDQQTSGGTYLPTVSGSYYDASCGRTDVNATSIATVDLANTASYGSLVDDITWRMTADYAVLKFPYFVKYSGGWGTSGNPYKISTPADLVSLSNAKDDWGTQYHYELTNDIDMDGQTFHPIGYKGDADNLFKGTFNGNNCKISNLTITPHSDHIVSGGIGLFGRTQQAIISNIGIHNISINCPTYERVAGIAGNLNWGTNISNCYVIGGSIRGDGRVGAIVGYNAVNPISNCLAKVDVTGNWTVGGIVGTLGDIWATGVTVNNVVFYGKVNNGNGVFGEVKQNTSGGTPQPVVTGAYFNTAATSNGGPNATRRTQLELLDPANYSGFNFSGTWAMKTSGYAYLSSFPTQNFESLLYDGPNNAPTADAGDDQTCNEFATITLDGSGSSDPDPAQNMFYTWKVPSGFDIDDETAEKPEVTVPGCNATTNYEIYLKVSDAIATSEWDTMIVTINDTGNVPPVIEDGSEVGLGNSLYTLGLGNIYDPDGDNLSFTWTAPTGIILSDIHAANPSFQAPYVGNTDIILVFTVEISDGEYSGTATRTVRLQQYATVPFKPIYVLILFALIAATAVIRKRLF